MTAFAELVSKNSGHLATFANVALVAVISLSVAQGVMFVMDLPQAETSAPTRPGQASAKRPVATPSISHLNLFGEASQQEVEPQEVVDAPTTSLNLELQGVFTAEDPKDSTAIIADKGRTGELYKIGERVPGNASLNAVYPDHVLLKRGARIEKLPFYPGDSKARFLSKATDSGSGRGRRNSAISNELRQENASTGSSRLQQIPDRIAQRRQQISEGRNSSNRSNAGSIREQMESYKQRLNSDPDEVLSELGVVAEGNSAGSGYRIGGEVSASVLRQSGLRQGDLILSVNGKPVGNIQNDKTLIDQTMAAGRARVEIQRGSRKFYVNVPIPKQ